MYVLWAGAGIPVVLIGIVAGSLLVERFWCRALCPLGGLLGLAALASPFGRKVGGSCNDCGKCHRTCPMGAISKDNGWDATACTKCLKCEKACPKAAIGFGPSVPHVPAVSPVETGVPRRRRRARLAGLIGGGRGGHRTSGRIDPAARRPRRREVQPRLRPLRQLREGLHRRRDQAGRARRRAGAGFHPVARLRQRRLRALRHLRPGLPHRRDYKPSGGPDQDRDRQDRPQLCIAWKDNKKCLICNEVCPKQAVKGAGKLQPVVDEDACVGCGNCQHNCPVDEKAIRVSSTGERRRS